MRVNLNEDGSEWADLADVSELRDGDRKAVNKVISVTIVDGQGVLPGGYEDEMVDALLVRVVRNWSYTELPLPGKDPKSLDKLTISAAAALHKAVEPHVALITGQVDPTKRDTDPTEGSSS